MIAQGKFRFVYYILTGLIFSAIVFIFSGCGQGLPKHLKAEAKSVADLIKQSKGVITSQKETYQKITKSPGFTTVESYAQDENWVLKFEMAKTELNRAADLYKNELIPLIKKNNPESVSKIRSRIVRIQKILENVHRHAAYPANRYAKIRNSMEKTHSLKSQASRDAQEIYSIVHELKTGSLAKAIDDFPDMSERIQKKFTPLSELDRQSRNHIQIVNAEFQNHGKGKANYAAFTDSVVTLAASVQDARSMKPEFSNKLKELYTSYTKVLKDMKEEYTVTIKRESWNENSDYYDPRFTTFQRQVDSQTYEAINADNVDTIASIAAGYFGSKFKNHIGSHWKALNIMPAENWTGRGHNAASFWVENAKEAYFHKYILENDGRTTETDWEKVKPSFYEKNFEYLGMAILAKPYGVFEEERMTRAAPPGMAYVGNPEYGEWKEDNNGERFWSWYGKYAFFSSLFFFPPFFYHYNSWYGWHNNYRYKQSYFGKTKKGFQQFGTYGSFVRTSPAFQNTSFAKSGGLKSQMASVRGASASIRGGGPKTKGK